MQAFPLTGLGLVALFLVLTLMKKNKQRPDLFLIIFFILVGAELTYRSLRFSGIAPSSTWLVGLDLVYWILFGPVMYLYAGSVIRKNEPFRPALLLHLVPLGIVLIPFIQFLLENPGISFFQFAGGHPVYRWVISIFWEYCVLGYLAVLIFRLIRLQNQVPGFFSSRKHKDLRWLLFLSSGFACFIVISMTMFYLEYYRVIPAMANRLVLSQGVLILYLLIVGVFGYKQKGIFSEFALEEVSNLQFRGSLPPASEHEFKYRKSGLQEEESQEILGNLKRVMKTQQPFIDCELNLQDLAAMLNTSVHKLSQVINAHFCQNFFDYVNTYRVEEVKRLLRDSKNNHLKVISLAYDCGFNSKSAFYTAFKKNTGMTPVEYRRKNQPEHATIFTN